MRMLASTLKSSARNLSAWVCLGDWENPYLTLNKEYEADELRLFADIVEAGICLSREEADLLEHPVPHGAGRGRGGI